jgi:hypothetical protein
MAQTTQHPSLSFRRATTYPQVLFHLASTGAVVLLAASAATSQTVSPTIEPPTDISSIDRIVEPTLSDRDRLDDRPQLASSLDPTAAIEFPPQANTPVVPVLQLVTPQQDLSMHSSQSIAAGLQELSLENQLANNPNLGSTPVAATPKKWGVGVHAQAGTLGFFGIDAGYRFNNNFHARLGFNAGGVGTTYQNSGVDYDANLNLSNIHLLGDYYPFGGGLRLTGGFIIQNNRLTGTAKPGNNNQNFYDVNGNPYPVAAVGQINASAAFGSSVAPYLGIGFGTPISPGLGFNFDLGVMFPGSPSVSLTNSGANPVFQASPAYQVFQQDLQAQQDKTNKDISGFSVYPVLSIGLSYAF